MTWTLSAAGPDDLERLLPLVRAYHDFEAIKLDEQQRRNAVLGLLQQPTLGGIWFVQQQQQIVGYIALCVGYSIEFGGLDAFIDEFYIEHDWRGQGGGEAALVLIQAHARQREIQALHLEVARDNSRARRLYQRCGLSAREKYTLMSVQL